MTTAAEIDAGIVGDGMDSDAAIARWLRAERDAGRLAFDDGSDPPALGTKCWFCERGQAATARGGAERRHGCPAKGWLGDVPVCAECGAGEQCGQARAVDKRLSRAEEYGEFELGDNQPGPVRQVPLEEAQQSAQAAESNPWAKVKESLSVDNLRRVIPRAKPGRVPRPAGMQRVLRAERKPVVRGDVRVAVAERSEVESVVKEKVMAGLSRQRISDEIREKVKAEFGTMSNEALARKYGISGPSVSKICGPGKRLPTPAAGEMVTLEVPEAALGRIFLSMPLGLRAQLIQRALSEATA